VRWLREQGYERVLLIGNSGGAALVSLYQSQAEDSTSLKRRPAIQSNSNPPTCHRHRDILSARIWVVHGCCATGSIPQRSTRAYPDSRADPSLDMFNPANGPASIRRSFWVGIGRRIWTARSALNAGRAPDFANSVRSTVGHRTWHLSFTARWPTRVASMRHSTLNDRPPGTRCAGRPKSTKLCG